MNSNKIQSFIIVLTTSNLLNSTMCFTKGSSKSGFGFSRRLHHDPIAIKHYNEHCSPLNCEVCFSVEIYTEKLEVATRRFDSLIKNKLLEYPEVKVPSLYDLPLEEVLNIAGKMPWDRDLEVNRFAEFFYKEYLNYKRNELQFCSFCYNNARKEVEKVGGIMENCSGSCPWKGHSIKNAKGIVTCPLLRNLSCTNCGATGDNAHTKKHCPHPILIMKN